VLTSLELKADAAAEADAEYAALLADFAGNAGLAVKLTFLAGVRVPKHVFGRWGGGGEGAGIGVFHLFKYR